MLRQEGYHLLPTSSPRLDLFRPPRGKRWGRASSFASASGATGPPTTAEAALRGSQWGLRPGLKAVPSAVASLRQSSHLLSSRGWILTPWPLGRGRDNLHPYTLSLFWTTWHFRFSVCNVKFKGLKCNPNVKQASRAGVFLERIETSSDVILKRLLGWVIPLGSLLPFKYGNN